VDFIPSSKCWEQLLPPEIRGQVQSSKAVFSPGHEFTHAFDFRLPVNTFS
jgi:hypothetical protein